MRGVLFASLVLLSGCFKYVPVTGGYDQIEQGSELRADFIEGESFDLSDLTVHNIVGMDAEFVRQDNSDLIFSAFWLDSSVRDVGFPGDGWSVRIPISNISQVELKKIDWWRSTGIVAGFLIASYFGWDAVRGGRGDGGEIPPGDGGVVH